MDSDDRVYLLDPSGHGPVAKTETHDGVTFRAFSLADPSDGERGGWTSGMTKLYGPEDGKTYSRNEMLLFSRKTPTVNATSRLAPTGAARYVAWLVWESWKTEAKTETTTNWIVLAATELDRENLAQVVNSTLHAPLSIARINAVAAMGVPYAEGSDASCEIVEFAVTDGTITGRVITRSGDATGVPARTATVTLLGTGDLASGFVEIGDIAVDADGRFALERPAGCNFFKLRISVREATFE